MKKLRHISIRIDDETLKKLHFVAKYEGRSASGQIMYLINKSIRDFEAKNGEIKIPESDED